MSFTSRNDPSTPEIEVGNLISPPLSAYWMAYNRAPSINPNRNGRMKTAQTINDVDGGQ